MTDADQIAEEKTWYARFNWIPGPLKEGVHWLWDKGWPFELLETFDGGGSCGSAFAFPNLEHAKSFAEQFGLEEPTDEWRVFSNCAVCCLAKGPKE